MFQFLAPYALSKVTADSAESVPTCTGPAGADGSGFGGCRARWVWTWALGTVVLSSAARVLRAGDS